MRAAADYLGIHACVVRIRKATESPELPCKLPAIKFRKVETDKLLEASDDSANDLDHEFVAEAIERGDVAFGAFDGDNLVAYTWRTVTRAPHTEKLWIRTQQPFSYAYKSFTRHSHRGQRIIPSLINFSDSEMLKLGFTHRVGLVAVTNFSSLQVGRHIGARVIGYVVFASYFGRCFSFRSREVVKIGFDLFTPQGQR